MGLGDKITVAVTLFGFTQALYHLVMTAWHGMRGHQLHALAHFAANCIYLLCVNALIYHLKRVLPL